MADASTPSTAVAALGAQKAYGAQAGSKSTPKIDAAAEDFEAVYLTQMMEQMFSGLGKEGPLGAGEAGGAYRSMLADQYGRTVAASGGVGIADYVRRELIQIQEGSSSS